MALFHVPHIALGAELSDDFEERTSIVGVRQFLATFGGLLAIGIGFGVYFKSTAEFAQGQFNVAAYSPYALTLAILMSVAMLACTWGTRAQIARLRQPDQAAAGSAWLVIARMWRETIGALQNASFRWLFFGVLVVFLMVGADAALSLYMNTFFWELRSTDLIFYNVAAPIGIMIGALFTRQLNRLFDKKPAVVWGTSFWAICQMVPVLLRFADAFPANGTRRADRGRWSRSSSCRARASRRRWSVSIRWSPTSRTKTNSQPANGRKASSSRRCRSRTNRRWASATSSRASRST